MLNQPPPSNTRRSNSAARWWVIDKALGASQQWQGDTRDEKEGWIGNIDGIMEMDQVAIVGLNGISHLCWRGMN